MNAKELKEYIKINDKAIDLLELAGCKNPRRLGDEVRAGRTDSSNDTGIVIREDLSGSIYSSSKVVNGDIYNILMEILNKNFRDVMSWIHKSLGLKFDKVYKMEEKTDILDIFHKAKSVGKNNREIRYLDEGILDGYTKKPHIEFVKEGLHPDVMMKFDLRYDFYSNRVIFPYRYWKNGKLIGLTGRTLNEDYKILGIPKYKIYKKCPKQLNLYGLWENYEMIQRQGYVIVVEGEKGVIKLKGWNYPAVALSGWNISDEQVKILIGLDVDIILALDNDIDEESIKEECGKFKNIRSCKCIKDTEGLLGEKDSPYDKGIEVFKILLKNLK